jgi:hypothetical protein
MTNEPVSTADIATVTPIEMIENGIRDCRYDLDRYESNRQTAERERDVAEAHITEIRLSLMRLEEIMAHIRRLDEQEDGE